MQNKFTTKQDLLTEVKCFRDSKNFVDLQISSLECIEFDKKEHDFRLSLLSARLREHKDKYEIISNEWRNKQIIRLFNSN